ncbi:MAG: hypothetical protein GY945_13975 [Rhodobacteraceae bacterium]|nr:hypothetical protein [Paracoccaceae bacterium]
MTGGMAEMSGDIHVKLRVQNGRVDRVECVSSRPTNSAWMFIGKPVERVTRSIGAVYSLCGSAQTIAALMAVENALAISVGPEVRAARDLLRLSEMLTQTAMRLCLHWPSVLGLKPEPKLVRDCLATEQAFETYVMGGPDWKTPGAGLPKPDTAANEVMEGLTNSIGETKALTHAIRSGLNALGLQSFGALTGGARPEQGALTRNWTHEAVINARFDHGVGLLARLEASLADLNTIPKKMRAALDDLEGSPATSCIQTTGEGFARVETARGTLTHQISIKDNKIIAYRIDAPTEANFHSDGPVRQGLLEADASDISALTQAAQLHILAIDPCVEFHVEVDDA